MTPYRHYGGFICVLREIHIVALKIFTIFKSSSHFTYLNSFVYFVNKLILQSYMVVKISMVKENGFFRNVFSVSHVNLTVNQIGWSPSVKLCGEIQLRYLISCIPLASKTSKKGQKIFWRPNPKSKTQNFKML